MRRVWDLHNDCVTAHGTTVSPRAASVLHAIWTTRLTKAEIRAAKERCVRAGVPYAFEDCGCLGSDERDVLLGARSASLTWNDDNAYAGGAHGQGGLSRDGRRLIGYLEQNGIALDLAHLNPRSFFDALEASTVPPLVTHTALCALHPHPRNLSHGEICALIERGGVVGLCAVAEFYDGAPDALVRAIDTYCSAYGSRSLCIGTDFCGTERYVDGLTENNYENLVKAVEKLLQMGYNDSVIDAILVGNAEAYFARIAKLRKTRTGEKE